jgi:hypothetical protein
MKIANVHRRFKKLEGRDVSAQARAEEIGVA